MNWNIAPRATEERFESLHGKASRLVANVEHDGGYVLEITITFVGESEHAPAG